jgi:hypothetical protein
MQFSRIEDVFEIPVEVFRRSPFCGTTVAIGNHRVHCGASHHLPGLLRDYDETTKLLTDRES